MQPEKKSWAKDQRPLRADCTHCGKVTTSLGKKSARKFQIGRCSQCQEPIIFRPYLTVVNGKGGVAQATLSTPPALTLVK